MTNTTSAPNLPDLPAPAVWTVDETLALEVMALNYISGVSGVKYAWVRDGEHNRSAARVDELKFL